MSSRFKRTAYRAWHRAVFRLQTACGMLDVKRQPAQTIFLHIPKTAGSSVNEYFASFTGSRGSDRFLPIDMYKGDDYYSEVSEEGLEKAHAAMYVTGHFDWHTLEAIRRPDAFVFTFLRDPAERLLSFYHYIHHIDERKQTNSSQKAWFSGLKSLTLEEFCAGDDPDGLYATNNLMVRQMAGRQIGTAATDAPFEEMLAQALKNLQTLNYVGFQNSFDNDFQALVKKTGFPPLRLPKENITKKLAVYPGPAYVAKAGKQDILKLAAPRLAWDIKFYQQAQSLVPEINKRPFIKA